MKKYLFLLLLLVFGCTTTKTVVDRVEVPVPYWDPPQNIQKLPDRARLECYTMTPEEAQADTQEAFQALGEDIRALIEENETIRYLYEELVKLVEAKPVEPAPDP